jgi:hypothetical protein
MSESLRERLVQVLSAPNSPLREEGVRLFVEHVLGHKLRDAIDLQQVHTLVLSALTRENLARSVERHVLPGWQRYAAVVPASQARVGDLVSETARDKLRTVAAELRLPRAKWAQGAVEPALLRKLLGPVWVQVMLNFAKRFPIPGMGGVGTAGAPVAPAAASRGFAGMLGRSLQQRAERLVDAGRSAMEGLGIDVEKKLLTAARDFSDNAMSVWNEAMRERLASEEGRALVAAINVGVVEHVLKTRFPDLQRDAAQLPIEQVLDLVPDIVAHAAHGDFVQEIVQRELSAYLALEGERTLAALLAELGVLDETRALLVTRGDQLVRSLAAQAAFADWLGRLLDA